MLQYGELITNKLASEIGDSARVYLRFPENWQQYAPAVFVVFNGYEIVSSACNEFIIDTHWAIYTVVKDAAAQRDLSLLDSRADAIVNKVFDAVQGEVFDDMQVLPACLTDRVAVPDVGASIGIYPLGFSIRCSMRKENGNG